MESYIQACGLICSWRSISTDIYFEVRTVLAFTMSTTGFRTAFIIFSLVYCSYAYVLRGRDGWMESGDGMKINGNYHLDDYSSGKSESSIDMKSFDAEAMTTKSKSSNPSKFGIGTTRAGSLPRKSVNFINKMKTRGAFRIPANARVNIYDYSDTNKSTKTIISKLLEKERGNDEFKRRLKDLLGSFNR